MEVLNSVVQPASAFGGSVWELAKDFLPQSASEYAEKNPGTVVVR